jgi:hypothetical protein
VEYKGARLNCAYRVDSLVEDRLIIELKTIEQITGEHFPKGMHPQGHPRGAVADLQEARGSKDRTPDEL